MKNKFFKCLIAAICATSFMGCYDDHHLMKPSTMEVKGVITDEAGKLLPSIFVCVDSTYFEEPMCQEDGAFTDDEGKYSLLYLKGHSTAFMENWPSELLVMVIDTAGIYETQKKSFHVDVQYPKDPKYRNKYNRASVTADFVMKKK